MIASRSDFYLSKSQAFFDIRQKMATTAPL